MKILADTHTHSMASGHAYSTIQENIRAAAEKGLKLIALTDHAPAMQNTTSHAYFANLHVIPEELFGVRVLKGVELNIIDFEGTLDLDEQTLSRLDISIASLHTPCISSGTKEENTRACICAMENPLVDILGHPGDPRYPMDFEEVFKVAKRTGTILEINNASLVPGGIRSGSDENIEQILRMSMKEDVPVVVSSDAHFYTGIGDIFYVERIMEKVGFPEDLVLNTDPQKLLYTIKRNKG
ncbi:phosphatase [Anaerotignum sp. MB30-C6]|uniref:phosphatase n=1 Tax=Anaerotignum sp. MB30-C6 TaxID=3070814 RepID=UPI0027DAD605|nr:phosphatase [Anaerotignum sp. MB30-C6]WMI82118.1 phosphatase [Anaerotignum sp. MB30-C6]